MTEFFRNRAAGATNVVKLTTRDVEDARRLLSLLATNNVRVTIEPAADPDSGVSQSHQTLVARARQILANRRRRHAIFGKGMFAEPAWDMLLLLYVMDTGQRQSVNRLSDRAGATRTTALRWIDYLERQQLIRRVAHPVDRRAVFLELTDKGREAVELYLSGTAGPAT